ncbi:hypothetical protein PGT21_007694 [Puccinia graminis f. sp. tritici]|uniref:Translation initiation factor eIF2B subunit epsilon n=2 Tax=Puccinia graminis f. sp. tritici TaxID=56615 RepID=E3JW02_PUCGT|nr:uncharacterized protein PGTG_02668 [Puccinia graminis f. sp. tritici CRL 75-36-700-3]EFP76227.2 hypothetical protein PGTG_02668 [Puccinia graminis f. sp. tritici CRL 75-36-700-3]KAA1117445.1 hypothetical protein PGT21_007694 [Puccinia graminis f. sp. tritici]
MAPKHKPNQTQIQADLKDEQILQSVLLADPFGAQHSWGPLSRQANDEDEEEDGNHKTGEGLPWCLMPLLGTPLLSWTLDSLALGGVQQVFLFIRDGTDMVRSYLSTTSYLNPDSSMVVSIIPTTSFTPGDVMREVDSRALLKTKTGSGSDIGTFVLARCGYIGNLDLSKAAQRFTSRRKEDGGLPCLSGVMESRTSRMASSNSTAIHLLDPSSRLLYLHTDRNKFPRPKRIQIPPELFNEPKDLLMRSDLESVGIDLCSVEVPQLFTENFDYQLVRPDFVHGILTSDLLGKTILCEVVKESENLGSGVKWATLVGDVKTYDRAARGIIARRSQPFVLDQTRLEGHPVFSQRRGMIYIGKDVDLAPESKIGNSTCLAPSCAISHRAEIRQSFIGSSSIVGERSQVEDSYIFDHVTIGSNTRIKNSIIGSNVTIKADCVIEEGCLLGNGVIIGNGTELRGVNVGLSGPNGSCKLEGPGSVGVVWPRIEDSIGTTNNNPSDDSDDEEGNIDIRNLKFARLGATYQNQDLDSPNSSTTSLSSISSNASSSRSANIQNIESIGEVGSTQDFVVECVRSLERAFEEDHTVENATIELKTLRMASNVPQSQVRKIVFARVLTLVQHDLPKLNKWIKLIKNMMNTATHGNNRRSEEEEEEEIGEMVEILLDLQSFCCLEKNFTALQSQESIKFFSKCLQAFYNLEIISEESLLKWFKSQQSKSVTPLHSLSDNNTADDHRKNHCLKLREVGGKLLQMLMEADSESSEED